MAGFPHISFRINLGTLGFSAALVLSGAVLQGWGERGSAKAGIVGHPQRSVQDWNLCTLPGSVLL